MEQVTFYEVKRQASDINIAILKDKGEHFFQATGKFKKYHIEYKGLSMVIQQHFVLHDAYRNPIEKEKALGE